MMTEIIKKYCRAYGLTAFDLYKLDKKFKPRKVKGVHVDYMRMCLAFYLSETKKGFYSEIAKEIGYVGHTSISHQRKHMRHYIKTKDYLVYPYYEKLLEVAGKIEPEVAALM